MPPFFINMSHYFIEDPHASIFALTPEESKHVAKAMRKNVGDTLTITDGMGNVAEAEIIDNNKAKVVLEVLFWERDTTQRDRHLHLVVAPTKNPDRMEWLVEKCVEIGVEHISFIITDHSERKHLDIARMQRLAVAALKQSGGSVLPYINLTTFSEVIEHYKEATGVHKWIGYCDFSTNDVLISEKENTYDRFVMLVGPEGDFSKVEVAAALNARFEPVKLGSRVLRTETAAMVATTVIALLPHKL